jgi:hypothetical protein
MERDPIDSAGPALRGFRLQILYTLSRLIEPQTALSGQHIWPEGIEDLAILDADGSPREAVQVKGYGASLTLSDLKITLKRAVKIAHDHPDCVIRFLSFGPFGPELTDAWAGEGSSRNRVATKLKTRALERQWEHVVILSTFKGRSLNRQVRTMPLYRLTLDGASSELGWLDEVWHPVTEQDWAATGVSCWDTAEIVAAQGFIEAIGGFKAMIDHLSDWLPLTEIEGIDGKVIQSYIGRSQPQWTGVVQAFIDGCARLASSFNALSDDARERRAYLADAVTALRDHYHQLLPPGLGQEGQTELSTETCQDWVNAVRSRREALDTWSAAILIDALNEAELSA